MVAYETCLYIFEELPNKEGSKLWFFFPKKELAQMDERYKRVLFIRNRIPDTVKCSVAAKWSSGFLDIENLPAGNLAGDISLF